MVNFFQPALKQNITLKHIIGKIPADIITGDLKDNVMIESQIIKNFRTVKKENKKELNKIPIHKMEGD